MKDSPNKIMKGSVQKTYSKSQPKDNKFMIDRKQIESKGLMAYSNKNDQNNFETFYNNS